MRKPKLHIADARMLQLNEILKADGFIKYTQEFCDAMDFFKQNIRAVKAGTSHFTVDHIRKLCETFNIDANYILGFSETVYRRRILIKTTVNEKANGSIKKAVKTAKVKKLEPPQSRVSRFDKKQASAF